jgi:hypothetical protein
VLGSATVAGTVPAGAPAAVPAGVEPAGAGTIGP